MPARYSCVRPPSSATTPPVRRTSCRPEAWRAARVGLGLETFLKPIQFVRGADLSRARAIGLPLARLEGLPLHAAALELA